ncbi:MAG: hypothetical protein M1484_03650 [Patescibacteria group bacterium]|nr:hypothetical protein [Patescibacteria group bacterium]MCL5432155.1 hypothetical protein [Patescibacteria group bacterium]
MTITGKIGFGAKVSGKIAVDPEVNLELEGKIAVFTRFVPRATLEKAGVVGAVGVVVPTMHWRDFEYFQNLGDFPVLVLLKFGDQDAGKELAEKLEKMDGKNGEIDGDNKILGSTS